MTKARWWVLALAAHGAVLGAQTRSNDLSAPERAAGWRLLFDGRTLHGWRGLGYDTVPTAHWVVVDGAIKKIASGTVPKLADGQPAQGGDLMTLDTFGDFELRDRKSTRLNSSHSQISYAVFCLKKKDTVAL